MRTVKEDAAYEEIAEHLTSITPEVDRTFSRAAHRAGLRTMKADAPKALLVVKT